MALDNRSEHFSLARSTSTDQGIAPGSLHMIGSIAFTNCGGPPYVSDDQGGRFRIL